MIVYVLVKDKRTFLCSNVRQKKFETLHECEKWVCSLKNRICDSYRVLSSEDNKMVGRLYTIGDNS